ATSATTHKSHVVPGCCRVRNNWRALRPINVAVGIQNCPTRQGIDEKCIGGRKSAVGERKGGHRIRCLGINLLHHHLRQHSCACVFVGLIVAPHRRGEHPGHTQQPHRQDG